MEQAKRFLTIAAVVVLGIIIQVVLISADVRSTPTKTVIKFTKAYFNLDRSMSKYLCREFSAEEDVNVVTGYINRIADEARAQGFSLNYMRSKLYSIHTDIISKSDTDAQVRITAVRKRNINLVYTIIAKLFFIGETYEVDEIVNVIKEDGQWKVCGQAFSLTT
ncbi:MAG: hypothetical protein JSU83_05165 [Deltaproteobacteria bacterium]|nr:MAG: hypothetical protein JSU83_05165 [Deltaproteobacteria bacterium]